MPQPSNTLILTDKSPYTPTYVVVDNWLYTSWYSAVVNGKLILDRPDLRHLSNTAQAAMADGHGQTLNSSNFAKHAMFQWW